MLNFDEGGDNTFRAHEKSAFQTPQCPSRIASLRIEESMESSQVHSQLPDLSFSLEVVPNTQFYPSSISPFENTFLSLMHAARFEPPLGLTVSALYVQVSAVVAPSHAFQQQMAVPVTPVQPTMTHPHVNSPSVVSSAPEDEDMAAIAQGEGGLPTTGEGDARMPGVNGTGDGVDEDAMPGSAIGQAVRGQRVKKRRAATALEGLETSLERGVGTFVKAFERVELRRMELEEKRLEVQF
ncbi:hypothetical protein L7F22_004610 [Adiantum nelumboides]|nr:hypothetical protein [Adiantum nelumboides]